MIFHETKQPKPPKKIYLFCQIQSKSHSYWILQRIMQLHPPSNNSYSPRTKYTGGLSTEAIYINRGKLLTQKEKNQETKLEQDMYLTFKYRIQKVKKKTLESLQNPQKRLKKIKIHHIHIPTLSFFLSVERNRVSAWPIRLEKIKISSML